jgi:hypothetical protein
VDFNGSTNHHRASINPQAERILGNQNKEAAQLRANALFAAALVFVRNVRKFRWHETVAIGHLHFWK